MAMPTIAKSSTRVMVDIGTFSTVPRQAQRIVCLFASARITPRLENPISRMVTTWVSGRFQRNR